MNYFIHPQAICESRIIGEGTRVGAFAHILPGAKLGRNCRVFDYVFIENDVEVGDRVTISVGVQLWDGLRIEDDVSIGPNATFAISTGSRKKPPAKTSSITYLRRGCSIGANATVAEGVSVGAGAIVESGAVVTKTIPPNAIVTGNPGQIAGYVSAQTSPALAGKPAQEITTHGQIKVKGVELRPIPAFDDIRGKLVAAEIAHELPFRPARFFVVYGVPSSEVRGEHSHKQCHQVLICAHGTVHVVVDDGSNRQEIILDNPAYGLYMPPLIWGTQYRFTADAVLLVFASHSYDPADYIRDYESWIALVQGDTDS